MTADMQHNYTDFNAAAWDQINDCLTDKTTAISHDDYIAARNGALRVSLAGAKTVPEAWFPSLNGADVLALACGGGQQAPIFAAHGANVTVTDISKNQLAAEQHVAEREGYHIRIVRADLSRQFPFADHSFDLIFNPVSNCYIEDIIPMWQECARVLRSGGVLMSGFVKEELFLFEPDFRREDVLISRHTLPFHPLRDLSAELLEEKRKNRMPLAFSHTLTEQIGGILQAGFTLTDLYEDCDGGGLIDKYMNAYVAVRAVRK